MRLLPWCVVPFHKKEKWISQIDLDYPKLRISSLLFNGFCYKRKVCNLLSTQKSFTGDNIQSPPNGTILFWRNLAQSMQCCIQRIYGSIYHFANFFIMSKLNLSCALTASKSNQAILTILTRIFWEAIDVLGMLNNFTNFWSRFTVKILTTLSALNLFVYRNLWFLFLPHKKEKQSSRIFITVVFSCATIPTI